jgi:hypothetical protein
MSDDPFAVLGLGREATLGDVRAARRRLAFDVHPDRAGGDASEMQRVNAAFEACVAHLTGRRPLDPPASQTPASRAPAPQAPAQKPTTSYRRPEPGASTGRRSRRPGPVERDAPSFTVDALPAETFEALLVAVSWIGEVLDDDPPYLLECHLFQPAPCWCRLEVVPDAGGSTVSITVAGTDAESVEPGFVEQVRDVWVEQLNQLGRPTP